MSETEIPDDTAPPPVADTESEPPAVPPAALAAVVALAAAAALTLLAAFRTVYTASFELSSGKGTYQLAVDGWGRFAAGAASPAASHGIRFGIALVVCAALFLLLAAVVTAAAVDPATWIRRMGVVAGIAIAATGAVAGILGTALLTIESTGASFDTAYSDAAEVSTTPGWFVWWLVGSLVLGAAAVAALLRLRATPAPAAAGPPADTPADTPADAPPDIPPDIPEP